MSIFFEAIELAVAADGADDRAEHALGDLERLMESLDLPMLMRLANAGVRLARTANSTGRIVLNAPYELPGEEQ